VEKIRKDGYLLGERHGPGYLEGIEVKRRARQKYAYLMRGTYPKEIYIPYREELPRLLISLIVSVLVTFGITMVITRPIGSLREAARQLASGNLRARAKWPKGKKIARAAMSCGGWSTTSTRWQTGWSRWWMRRCCCCGMFRMNCGHRWRG
jgi:nitrogen fixation/metabolism regulation signal transduction histidine kinase